MLTIGNEQFLTTSEAAELLSYTGAALRWRRAQNLGPPTIRYGSRYLYRRSAVDLWVSEGGPIGDRRRKAGNKS